MAISIRNIKLLLLTAIFVVYGCRKQSPQTLWGKISIVEVIPEINSWADSIAATEYGETLFGRIGAIAEDDNHYFYISDLIAQHIKVFDSKGNYLRSIGQRGRGAGEFMNLLNFTLSVNNNGLTTIVVTDDVNRVISEFSTDGELLDTYQIPAGTEYPKGPFIPVETETNFGYLFQYKLFEGAKDEDCLFHFFSADFSRKISCFGSFQDLWYSRSTVYNYLTEAKPGHFILTGDKTIYYAPYLYDGSIYTYRFDKERQDWIFSEIIDGLVYERKPINEQAEPFDYRTSHRGQSYYGQINNQSLGLFETPSGLYHFTKIRNQYGDYWFGLERYSKEGELQEYVKLIGITSDDPSQSFALHRDSSGFYLLGVNSNGLPEIKQLNLASVPDFTHN